MVVVGRIQPYILGGSRRARLHLLQPLLKRAPFLDPDGLSVFATCLALSQSKILGCSYRRLRETPHQTVGRFICCRGDPARSLSHGHAVVRPSSHQNASASHIAAPSDAIYRVFENICSSSMALVITGFASRGKLGCMKLEFHIPRFIAESAYCGTVRFFACYPSPETSYGHYIDFPQTLPL